MRAKFEQELLFGQQAEGRVRDLLQYAGAFVSKYGNTNKNDFQVVFNNQTHRVEIKNEDRYASSGNICAEVLQGIPQKPSGVMVSEASLIVHTLADRCAIYRRSPFCAWLRDEYRNKRIKLKSFGDNHNQGFIVPVNSLLQYTDWFDIRPTTIAECLLWLT